MSTIFSSNLFDLSTKLVIYYLTSIYVIGILGNVLNIIIFSHRRLRSNLCSEYLIGMSIIQIVFFNSLALTRIITYLTNYDLGRIFVSLCKIRVYLYVFNLGLLRQFLCLITINRWMITSKYESIRKLNSPCFTRWSMCLSTLFWLIFSSHALVGYEITSTRGCTTPLDSIYALFYVIQITISSIIPFLILTLFSILTLYNIRDSYHHRRVQPIVQNNSSLIIVLFTQNINRRRYENQLIKISFIQVIFYVLLSMTSTMYPLYSLLTSSQRKSSDQNAIDAFINNTGLLLLYTYSAKITKKKQKFGLEDKFVELNLSCCFKVRMIFVYLMVSIKLTFETYCRLNVVTKR
ncbi:hypothetical protein I4U23_011029 [Adineta vaga]|nr:hypothetical protein I4U23_011029 [Adineta vaga]